MDELPAETAALIAERVAASRAAQGLPRHLTDVQHREIAALLALPAERDAS